MEEIDNAHVICLMHKLISSSRNSDDLSIGFHRNNGVRENKWTNNRTTEGIKEYIMLEFNQKIILVLQRIKINALTVWVKN